MSWRSRWQPREKPEWWPRDEPWPPRTSRFWAERRRDRFVRRAGWYSFLPVWILLWIAFSYRNRLFISGPESVDSSRLTTIALVIGFCGVVAALVAGILRRISRPVADIVGAADRISRRDYRVRVQEPERGPRWVAETARAFNSMAQELETQDEARRHLMADIAHELRTPLAVVQAKLEGVIDGVYPADAEQLQGLLENTRVVSRLVEDLRTLASAESGAFTLKKEPTDIVSLANDVVASLSERANQSGVTIGVRPGSDHFGETPTIDIDPVRIREVLMNLVANALRYTPNGGRVTIGIERGLSGVTVSVADTGAGISEAELPRIFDRFHKGADSSGSGLGLTIARRFVEAHGGTLRAESRVGQGTTMTFDLPERA